MGVKYSSLGTLDPSLCVPGIRLGNRLEEPKKDPLALGLELLNIIWNHGRHALINPDTNPSPIPGLAVLDSAHAVTPGII